MEQELTKPVEEMDAMVAAEEAAGKAEQEEKDAAEDGSPTKLDILNEWKGAPNKTAWLRNIAPSHRLGVARRRKRKRRCS